MKKRQPLDLAIVGMACRFPGAPDLSTFWQNIVAGRDATSDVPTERWNPSVFYDPSSSANDRVYCKRGGYLDPVPFDPAEHGIMPVTVAGGEPEQFLILQAAKEALTDAGLASGVPDGRRVEVVIGRGNYFNRGNLTRLQHGRIVAQTLAILESLHPEWSSAELEAIREDLKASLPPFGPETIAGQITNATASRLANRLDLSGASFVVDAASASSLVALDLASRALVEGRADLAIVGGVYLSTDIDFPMVFTQLGALSRTGRARPFSKDADGTLPGEGVGVVILERLTDAERSGKCIYAVLKGVGLASDGRGQSLAAPSARGHARALRRAYRNAHVDPGTIGLVEGHGLGVPAADRAELKALRAIFPPASKGKRTLGAVSSMIGHAMPAAGMAGLIKTALALHHRILPPTLYANPVHPLLDAPDSPFVLNDQPRPWVHGAPQHPRRAGVSAFGFAGISGHACLEEHPQSADGLTPGCLLNWDSEAILLAAPNRRAWIERARALAEWLAQEPQICLKDLAYTLNTAPSAEPFRVGIVAASLNDLKERLTVVAARLEDPQCRTIHDARGTYFWEEPQGTAGSLAILFPGEGSQYPGMLADLCMHFPEVRQRFDTADRVSFDLPGPPPSAHLFGAAAADNSGIWSIRTAIDVVLSAQWGLYQLLRRLNLRPQAVLGHSSGEFLALAAAGVFEIDSTFVERIGELGAAFEKLESSSKIPAAMLLAVAAGREKIEALCAPWRPALAVAMDNCPHQVVLAGPPQVVKQAAERLQSQGVLCEVLRFSRAYHTPEFGPALGPVRRFFESLGFHRPRVPLYSCALARTMPDHPGEICNLAVEQWTRPVRFRSTIEQMYQDGVRLFVEVGSRGNLTGFVEDTLRGQPHFAIASNLPRRSGLLQLNHLVAALFAQGVALTTDHLYARRRPSRVDVGSPVRALKDRPTLAIGFPEMRLSADLVERLRGGPEETASASGSRNGFAHAHDYAGNGQAAGPAVEHSVAAPAAVHGTMSGESSEGAMLAYFETMDQFLDTQRAIMDAYLGVAVYASAAPKDESGQPPLEKGPEPSEGPPRSRLPQPRPGISLAQGLLEKVSQRTGYPPEMLELDLDLEGDLGIDSIKRVEILGDLQQQGVLGAEADLDRLSRCRTLRQVIEVLESQPRTNTPAEPGPWVGEIQSLEPGVRMVSWRTLDLHDDSVAEHHTLGGRRVSAIDPERKGLPVVPFTVMAEMLAQAAGVLVPAGVLLALRDVRAHKWIRYEEEPIRLEICAERIASEPGSVRVQIYNRGLAQAPRAGPEGPVVEGVVVFGSKRPAGPLAGPWVVPEGGPCRFTAEELYRDQWLFHGPAMQALVRVGPSSPHGIEGTLRVLPRSSLLGGGDPRGFFTDPIVLDSFTHLLGCWGLDKLSEGDVIFPLRLAELILFEPDPGEGAEVECRIMVKEVMRHRVLVDCDIIGPDGRVWMRLTGWEDWRFYWPNRYRDHFREPDRVFMGEELELPGAPSGCTAIWLEPPSDMGKPVWRDVLEWVQFGPQERAQHLAQGGPEERRSLRLWGRIAAKEAVRQLWLEAGSGPVFPADLVIEPDEHGRPVARALVGQHASPSLSIAHADGVAVALASTASSARVGIDVERIEERDEGFERTAFSEQELDLLQGVAGGKRQEWLTRFWCAKEALAKATGFGMVNGPRSVEVISADPESGEIEMCLGHELALRSPGWPPGPVRVVSARRGDYVWAWTLGEAASP